MNNDFYYYTKQDLMIVAAFIDSKYDFERYDVIVYRKSTNDFIVGCNYDLNSGVWGNGVYDFEYYDDAKKYLIKEFNAKKVYEFFDNIQFTYLKALDDLRDLNLPKDKFNEYKSQICDLWVGRWDETLKNSNEYATAEDVLNDAIAYSVKCK